MEINVPIVNNEFFEVKDNTIIAPQKGENIIEYYFENTGFSSVLVNYKLLQPKDIFVVNVGFLSIDTTSYNIRFLDVSMIKDLLVMKKKFIGFKKVQQ